MKYLFTDAMSSYLALQAEGALDNSVKFVRCAEGLWMYAPAEEGGEHELVQVTDPESVPTNLTVESGVVLTIEGSCEYRGGLSFFESVEAHALVTETGALVVAAQCRYDIDYRDGVRGSSSLARNVARKRGGPNVRAVRAVIQEAIDDACWLPGDNPDIWIDWPHLTNELDDLRTRRPRTAE